MCTLELLYPYKKGGDTHSQLGPAPSDIHVWAIHGGECTIGTCNTMTTNFTMDEEFSLLYYRLGVKVSGLF